MTQIANIHGLAWLALKGHIDDWTECDVFYSPDVPQRPDMQEPYLVVTDNRLEVPTRFVGADDVDEIRGTLALAVMVPVQWEYAQGLGIASRVIDYFPKGSLYEYGDAAVRVIKRADIKGAPYQDHGMQRFNVMVYWRSVG